jgi:FdhD protein
MSDAIASFEVTRLVADDALARSEEVAHEEPLEIQLDGVSLAVVMRTPGDDEDLVRGFLLTERVVERARDIERLWHCTTVPDPEADGNVMLVRLRPEVRVDVERLRRHTFASSSCGVCGKATIANAMAIAEPLEDGPIFPRAALFGAPGRLLAAQEAFAATGGVHAAGLVRDDGTLALVREDVGRHNAVDKVIGAAAHGGLTLSRHALVVSGRVSFELVQKAAAVRVPLLAGISAPTSLAVRAARALGVTLVGFLRGDAMNVYARTERLRP